jgi:hypothetical protein
MASAGTLLSALGSGSGGSDGVFVQRILADLNTTESPSNPVMQTMPPPAGNGRVVNAPNPNTTYPLAMDPSTANAHMIGKAYPTPGDFATMMNQGGSPAMEQGHQFQQQMGQGQATPILTQLTQGKGWFSDYMNQLRQPLLVAILVFVFSLPVVNVLLGHYMPSLLRASGDLTTIGLLVKSLGAGIAFWCILHILVPLVSN